MPQLKPPTFKQRKFVHRYLKHGNAQKAILESYDTKSKKTADQLAFINKKSPNVQAYMKEIMEKVGVTDDKIAEKIKKIINAGTTASALQTATPQHALKALDMAAKLKDIFPAERKQIEKRTAKLNINLDGKSQEELQETLDTLLEEGRAFRKMMTQTQAIKENGTQKTS